MAYVPVPGTVMVELREGLDGEQIENTLYFNKAGAWTVGDMTALAEAIIDWWGPNLGAMLSNSLSLIEVFVTDLTTNTGAAVSVTTGLPQAGGRAMESAPNNVAPCISLHTGSRGRSFRGRNYIAGIGEDHVVASRFVGGFADGVQDAYNALIPLAATQACEWVVVSRFSGINPTTKKPIPRTTGISTPILSASFTDNVVDSQRKRLPNH